MSNQHNTESQSSVLPAAGATPESETPTPRTDNRAHYFDGPDDVAADFARALERELRASQARCAELEQRLMKSLERDGVWIDEYGACKVCGGEIPHGHTNECDIYKLEQAVRDAKDRCAKLQTERDGWKHSSETWELAHAKRHEELDTARRELADVREKLEAAEKTQDEEIGRWQDKIQAICQRLTPGRNIDGSGWDSGDPLDLSLAEISQAIGWHIDSHEETKSAVSAELQARQLAEAQCAAMRHVIDAAKQFASNFVHNKTWVEMGGGALLSNIDSAVADNAGKSLLRRHQKMESALQKHHQWHLDQTDRTPVYFGDTVGQINAEEYSDSELYEQTVAALAKEPA